MPTLVQPTLDSAERLQVLGVGGVVLAEHVLVSIGRLSFERNRRGYQAFESDEQAASGDGRRVVGERTVDVLLQAVDGDPHAQAYALDQALETASSLSYSGTTVQLAGTRGVTTLQPVGVGARDLRATITYLPSLATATNPANQPVLGPL